MESQIIYSYFVHILHYRPSGLKLIISGPYRGQSNELFYILYIIYSSLFLFFFYIDISTTVTFTRRGLVCSAIANIRSVCVIMHSRQLLIVTFEIILKEFSHCYSVLL